MLDELDFNEREKFFACVNDVVLHACLAKVGDAWLQFGGGFPRASNDAQYAAQPRNRSHGDAIRFRRWPRSAIRSPAPRRSQTA